MGERIFFSLLRSGFRSFRLETIMDHSPETGISSWCHSSSRHSTDLKDRSRSEQSSNRDSPTCFVIPSEATRPNRGICIWFFLELKEGNRRSHPAQLHLQLLMWHLLMWRGRPRPRLHLQLLMWHLLVWHGRLARVQQKGFQV